MRVGVYVDGFNLYYGAKHRCGADSSGWRWLDIRSLVRRKLPSAWLNGGAEIDRVVYCTAKSIGDGDPDLPYRQDTYLRALIASGCVDHIEYGTFVSSVRSSPLAIRGANRKPNVVESHWPVMVQNANREDVSNARFMVSHLFVEEKGSDVNVATHLLLDVMNGEVDAVVVISNDSDLMLPIAAVRDRVPVGLLNPGTRQLAGRLRDRADRGAGRHWWAPIEESDYRENQLPDSVGSISKPSAW